MITVTRKLYNTFIVYMCVSLDFSQHWTKLDTTGGPRPPVRRSHAACCIAGPLTGQEHPLLLVGSGFGGGVLTDMWVLDVDRGVWSEVSGLIVWYMMSYIKSVCYKHVLLLAYMWLCALNPGPRKGLEGPRASIESGANNIDCGRESGDMPPGSFTWSEVCSEAFEASFCACIHYVYTCKLLSLFSRLKSMTYWALASGLCSRHIRCVH